MNETNDLKISTSPSTGFGGSVWRPAVASVIIFALITGIAFPLVITALAQFTFPAQANGSLIKRDGVVVGSSLIGQNFSGPGFFHSRPSAAGAGYDGGNSSGTNLGPMSEKLLKGAEDGSFAGVTQLAAEYRKVNSVPEGTPIPADAVTRSASGLDPEISVANAELQAPRVAESRGLTVDEVKKLIREETSAPFAGVFGDERVHVLRLNLRLLADRKQ